MIEHRDAPTAADPRRTRAFVGAPGEPVSRIYELHQGGLECSRIARALGMSPYDVGEALAYSVAHVAEMMADLEEEWT